MVLKTMQKLMKLSLIDARYNLSITTILKKSEEKNSIKEWRTMKEKVYRVLCDDEVIAIFRTKRFAIDFIEYQATIGLSGLELEEVKLSDWLLQPREF